MSEERIQNIKENLYEWSKQIFLAEPDKIALRNGANAINQLQQENQQLKECYCNRTDCSGRIKDSKKYDSVAQQRVLFKGE